MFKTLVNRLLLVVVLFNLCALIGCHRGYYRRQADAEAQRLIREKAFDPRWDSADGRIDIDPQSRMFDPFSADHPPIPADDAASHQFMHRVDGKDGYPQWHANGDTNYIESPNWQDSLPVNEKGEVVLTLEKAYELALIHSPELQQQRETLYLSALDVSLDRFGFDTQLFTGFNSFLTTQGRLRNGSGVSSTTVQNQIGSNGGGLNFERLGVTGANFAVGLANTILFNFAGNNTQSATSLIDFSIIQPLLRGAGRDRIMESLTQAERTLLANVRQMERFRRGFYLQVAIGRDAGAGPSRGGNFLGNPGSASANAGGFFGLLETQQRLRNQRFNLRQQQAVLELFREFFLRERLDAVQLKQFETNFYRDQRSLLNAVNAYQTQLDRFKLSIGLPPDLEVVIDDSTLDQFELISDQVNERLIAIGELRKTTGTALNEVDNLFDELQAIEDLENGTFPWPTNIGALLQNLVPFIDEAEAEIDQIGSADTRLVESDIQKLSGSVEGRLASLKKTRLAIESGRLISSLDPSLFDPSSIQDPADLTARLSGDSNQDSVVRRSAVVKESLQGIRVKIADYAATEQALGKAELFNFIREEFQEKIPGQLSEMNNLVLELSLLQAIARSNTIEIADVDIQSPQAIEIARCMRRDWMNARASHVDNWRNIEFVADQLEAQVDLVFQGDIGNNGDNPFKLRYETGQLRAGFRFDAPIVRLAERNNYREALINYQQSRRQFYQFEDNVKRNLRDIVRNVDLIKGAFELDRLAVQTSIENLEINRFELEEPVAPGAGNGGNRLGITTAQNLTQAIERLNSSQDSFLNSWVQFEVLRRSLDFDMGTMQVNERGEWIDPGAIDGAIGMRVASKLGIELDCQYCNGVTTVYSENGTSYTSDGTIYSAPSGYYPEGSEPQSSQPVEGLPFETTEPVYPGKSIYSTEPSSFQGLDAPGATNGPQSRLSPNGRMNLRTAPSQPRVPSYLYRPVSAAKPTSARQVESVVGSSVASVQAMDRMRPKLRPVEAGLKANASVAIQEIPSVQFSVDRAADRSSMQLGAPVVDFELTRNSVPSFLKPESLEVDGSGLVKTVSAEQPRETVKSSSELAIPNLANQIPEKFEAPQALQATRLASLKKAAAANEGTVVPVASPVKAMSSAVSPLVKSERAEPAATEKMLNAFGEDVVPATEIDFDWRKRQYSLGGTLNRFRIQADR